MAFKKIEVRPSAGDGKPPSDIPKDLEDYCAALQAKLPLVGLKTATKDSNRIQLLTAAALKAVQVDAGTYHLAVQYGEAPDDHEVDPDDPSKWTANPTTGAFIFEATHGLQTCFLCFAFKD